MIYNRFLFYIKESLVILMILIPISMVSQTIELVENENETFYKLILDNDSIDLSKEYPDGRYKL